MSGGARCLRGDQCIVLGRDVQGQRQRARCPNCNVRGDMSTGAKCLVDLVVTI